MILSSKIPPVYRSRFSHLARCLDKAGSFADIIAVDGDPVKVFKAIERVKFVMKDGTVYVGNR
jgi:imidazolonepropionase-like amidohydrolase